MAASPKVPTASLSMGVAGFRGATGRGAGGGAAGFTAFLTVITGLTNLLATGLAKGFFFASVPPAGFFFTWVPAVRAASIGLAASSDASHLETRGVTRGG